MSNPVESLARTVAETAHEGQCDKAGDLRPAARFLADEARGLTNIAGAAHRRGDNQQANWMLTLANAFARKATELDPTLGIPLDVILAGEGDGDTVSERALGVSAVPAPEEEK